MLKNLFFRIFMMGMIVISFPSCHGIFDDIYDTPPTDNEPKYGFFEVDDATKSGKIYIDASSYTKWTYIDFETKTIHTEDIEKHTGDTTIPEYWDLAIHRYDAKTNDGSVLSTTFSNLSELKASGSIPQGNYVSDEQSKITTDMSGMMEGNILYVDSPVNPELVKWLNVDTSSMPPIYTLAKNVYILKNKDGKFAAILFTNYMNDSNEKGFITIEYIYPLEF